ncbi:hypothetical protein [Allokutzneria sp. NRRL B-24872]|uniref:hypothetical protein n=1 Tax=Allokutzneria sp. NRRL B-24872 TaxID=1137961 RepID=UPI0011784F61|nr:hypothetical protein [Allokutzneria sp. NRRL B-24872]
MSKEPAVSAKSVRTAVAVWLALSTFCALDVLLTWLEQSNIRKAVADAGIVPPESVDAFLNNVLWQKTIFQLGFAVVYIILAVLLRKGFAWTRVALIAASVFHVFLLLSGGSFNAVLILIIALVTGALMMTWRQPTTDWLATAREAR